MIVLRTSQGFTNKSFEHSFIECQDKHNSPFGLKEPSTWAGIGLILTAITPVLPLVYATPIGALVGVCGGIAYILRESKTDAK